MFIYDCIRPKGAHPLILPVSYTCLSFWGSQRGWSSSQVTLGERWGTLTQAAVNHTADIKSIQPIHSLSHTYSQSRAASELTLHVEFSFIAGGAEIIRMLLHSFIVWNRFTSGISLGCIICALSLFSYISSLHKVYITKEPLQHMSVI